MINIFVFMYIEGNGMNFSLLCTTIFCVWFCNLYLNMRICEALSLTSLRARIFTSQEITLSWVDTLNLPDSRNLIRFPFLLKYTHFLSLLRIVFLNSNLSLNSVCFRSLSQIMQTKTEDEKLSFGFQKNFTIPATVPHSCLFQVSAANHAAWCSI